MNKSFFLSDGEGYFVVLATDLVEAFNRVEDPETYTSVSPDSLQGQEYVDTLGTDTESIFCGTCGEPCKISKTVKESYITGYTGYEEIEHSCPASKCCQDYVYSARFWNSKLLQWDFKDSAHITDW